MTEIWSRKFAKIWNIKMGKMDREKVKKATIIWESRIMSYDMQLIFGE